MTEVHKQANRIPVESVDRDSVSAWDLPAISKDGKIIHGADAEKRKRQSERVEDVPRPAKSNVLTAEELERISREAYEEGFAEGKADGYNKGLEEGQRKAYNDTKQVLNEERKKLSAIAEALFAPMDGQHDALENAVVDMAVQLAKHLLRREIAGDPCVLYPVVKAALAVLPAGAKNIEVHLNRDDAELFKSACPDIQPEWKIVADPQLASGGCKVMTAESLVDYSLEKRIADYLADVAAQPDIDEAAVEPVTSYRKPAPDKTVERQMTADAGFDVPDSGESNEPEMDEDRFDFFDDKEDQPDPDMDKND